MDRSTCRWIPFKNSPLRSNKKDCQVVFVKGRWVGGCFHSSGVVWPERHHCTCLPLCACLLCGVMIILQSLLAIQSFAKSPFWQLKFDILGVYLGPAAIIIIFGYLDSLSSFCSSVVIPLQLLACCQSTFDCITWWLRADSLCYVFCLSSPPSPPSKKFHVFFVTKLGNFNN